jgi:predicted DNA-binding protein
MKGKKRPRELESKAVNYSLRMELTMRTELETQSNKQGLSSATLVRKAISEFLYNLKVEEEIDLLNKSELDDLPLLINNLETEEGNEELRRRFREAIPKIEKKDETDR